MDTLAEVTDAKFAERARSAIYHIEASNAERHFLWCDHSTRSPRPTEYTVEWSGIGAHGYLMTVGHVGELPVCVSLTLDEIAGKPVLFYEPTSRVVDHQMIEEWFAANLPVPKCDGGTRRAHCDAMNFAHCLHAIADAERQAA